MLKSNLSFNLNPKKLNSIIYEVLEAFGLSSKNVENSTLFIIRNTLSNYEYISDHKYYQLKEKRHLNETDILELVNNVIDKVNNKRSEKHKLKLEEFKLNPVGKEPKLNLLTKYTETIEVKTYWQILNEVLLENVLREKESINPKFIDYKSISSYIAQSSLQRVIEDFKSYKKAIVAYYKNPKSFTGKPELPQYKAKDSKSTFSIPMQRFRAVLEETNVDTGEIVKKEGFRDTFIEIIGKNKIYTDFKKTNKLEQSTVDEYNNFPLVKLVLEEAKARNPDYKVVEIKIIPSRSGKNPRVAYTVEIETKISEELEKFNSISLKLHGKPLNQLNDTQFKQVTKEFIKETKSIPNFMSIDPGQVNFATISYFNDKFLRSNIIECSKIKKSMLYYQGKIDKRTSEMMDEKSRSIQGKISSNKDNKGKPEFTPFEITKEEYDYLKNKYIEVSMDKVLASLRSKKQNKIDDYLHKTSKAVIQNAKQNNTSLIIVGRNKFRKQEINLGRERNQNEHNLSHSRFLEILKYKGILNNILVIDTEESYTSQTSFIDNEDLKTYGLAHGTKSQLNGERDGRKFETKDKTYHSDVNGSYNIARKVFTDFSYKTHVVNLNFNLIRLSNNGKNKFCCIVGSTGKPLNNESYKTTL